LNTELFASFSASYFIVMGHTQTHKHSDCLRMAFWAWKQ